LNKFNWEKILTWKKKKKINTKIKFKLKGLSKKIELKRKLKINTRENQNFLFLVEIWTKKKMLKKVYGDSWKIIFGIII
jgi:hypothetical protein